MTGKENAVFVAMIIVIGLALVAWLSMSAVHASQPPKMVRVSHPLPGTPKYVPLPRPRPPIKQDKAK